MIRDSHPLAHLAYAGSRLENGSRPHPAGSTRGWWRISVAGKETYLGRSVAEVLTTHGRD